MCAGDNGLALFPPARGIVNLKSYANCLCKGKEKAGAASRIHKSAAEGREESLAFTLVPGNSATGQNTFPWIQLRNKGGADERKNAWG